MNLHTARQQATSLLTLKPKEDPALNLTFQLKFTTKVTPQQVKHFADLPAVICFVVTTKFYDCLHLLRIT